MSKGKAYTLMLDALKRISGHESRSSRKNCRLVDISEVDDICRTADLAIEKVKAMENGRRINQCLTNQSGPAWDKV